MTDIENPARGADPRRESNIGLAVENDRDCSANSDDPQSYNVAIAFLNEGVPVAARDGALWLTDEARRAFCAPARYWWEGPPPPPPDDWPRVILPTAATIRTRQGARPKGREILKPKRFDPRLPFARMRAGAVLEIEEHALDGFREVVRRRRLPAGVPVTKTRAGATQAWFMWPSTLWRCGESDFPEGVRLLTDLAEAPPEPKSVPDRFGRLALPELPMWLALMAGARPAEFSMQCLIDPADLTSLIQMEAPR